MLYRSILYALFIINLGTPCLYATPIPHDNNWGQPTERATSPYQDFFPSMASSCYLLTRTYAPNKTDAACEQTQKNNPSTQRPASPAITVK